MKLPMLVAAGACLAATAGHANADTRVIASSGLWSTYDGTGDDGRQVCGITTIGADGRRINVQQYAGESGVELALQKDSWSIPRDTPLDLRVQFDLDVQIPMRAVGTGRQVGVRMSFDQSVPFMRALRNGRQVRVFFPSGNEPVWTGGLAGSGRAIDAFNDCRARLAPAAPTQPYSPPPTPAEPVPEIPSTPTQPFSAAPTTPSAPSPPAPSSSSLPPIPLAPGVTN